MHTTHLCKVENLVMLAVPPALLERLHLEVGATVGLSIAKGCLVVKPSPQPRYTLAGLLAVSDYSQVQPSDQREWVDAPAVGGELL